MSAVIVRINGRVVESPGPLTMLDLLGRDVRTPESQVVVAARVDDEIVDLTRRLSPRERPYVVEFVDTATEDGLHVLRHSTSHLMTQAVKRLYGEHVQLGVGPATADGFYQDYDLPELSDGSLPLIEEEMRKIISEQNAFERREVPKSEALAVFAGDELKCELIGEIPSETVTVYRQREHLDLCRGPHVANSAHVGNAFKLLTVSGAYWRGDPRRKQLRRIYGIVYPTQEQLDRELHRLEEVKRRDHRKLGAELELFAFTERAPGAPIFLPHGTVVYNELIALKREKMRQYGYVEVRTPAVLDKELWEISGHWEFYRQNMFTIRDEEHDREYAVKPMNCPGSALVYQTRPRSYKDLPMRLGEFGYVHRNELTGVLTGLLRVRAFTQDDAHLYLCPEQIEDEVKRTVRMFGEIYDVFGFKAKVALSTRPQERMGDETLWDQAEAALESALGQMGVEFTVRPGEGAFYGPKIDFQIEDCLGREWQCGTCQLDFQLPEKFGLTYVGQDGKPHRPVIIHPAAMGSIERFMAICIEDFEGRLPTWLSPVQALILPVSDKALDYAGKVLEELTRAGARAEVDTSSAPLGKRIRNAHLRRVPYMLIVGPKEAEAATVSVRDRLEQEQRGVSLSLFVDRLREETSSRRRVPAAAHDFAR